MKGGKMIAKEQSKCRECEELGNCIGGIIDLIEQNIDKAEAILASIIIDDHLQNIAPDIMEHLEKNSRGNGPNAARLGAAVAFIKMSDEYSELCDKESDFSQSSEEIKGRAIQLFVDLMGNEAAGAAAIPTFFTGKNFRSALVPGIKAELAKRSKIGKGKTVYAKRYRLFCEIEAASDFNKKFRQFAESEGDFSGSAEAMKLQAVSLVVDYLRTLPQKEAGAGIVAIIQDKYYGLFENLRPQIAALNEQASTPEEKEFFGGLEEFCRAYAAVKTFEQLYDEAIAKIKDAQSEAALRKVAVCALFECLDDLLPDSWRSGGRDEDELILAKMVLNKLFDNARPLMPAILQTFEQKLPLSYNDNELAYYFTLFSYLKGKMEAEEKKERAETQVNEFFKVRERTLTEVLALMDESPEIAEAVAKFAFCNQRQKLFNFVKAYLAEKARTDERYKIVEITAKSNDKGRAVLKELTELLEKLRQQSNESIGEPGFSLN